MVQQKPDNFWIGTFVATLTHANPDTFFGGFQKSTIASRVIAITLATAGVLVGVWEAHSCAQIQFGYVAGYSYAVALFLSIAGSILGIVLLIYWRTRTVGIGLLASGVLSYVLFLGGMAVLAKFDRVAWRHEPPLVSFGPDQRAAIVVYFQHGTTNEQIEDFVPSVLEQPAAPRHDGRDYPEFVSSYSRLLPSQANGFDGCSLTFWRNDSSPAKAAYLSRIRGDTRVFKVFVDVSPDSIEFDSRSKKN